MRKASTRRRDADAPGNIGSLAAIVTAVSMLAGLTGCTTDDASNAPKAAGPSPRVEAAPRGDDVDVVAEGTVVDVVDGDTIELADGTRVRLALVDTPEMHGGVEACGPEAARFTANFVAGQTVEVHRPRGAARADDYGRTLGEVVRVRDGRSLNVALAAAGLGAVDERFVAEDPDLAARSRAAAPANPPACHDASAGPVPERGAVSPGAGAALDFAGETADTDSACHPAYRPCLPVVDDLDCADADVRRPVTVLGNADPYRLDGRSTFREDGVGCESYAR